jgi:hypothetical protein
MDAISELHERSIWLPAAAGSLLLLMREHPLYAQVEDKRQLLDTLGQLLQEVLLAAPAWTTADLRTHVCRPRDLPFEVCLCAAQLRLLVHLQLVGCVRVNEVAAAAGLWPPDPLSLAAYGTVEQLRLSMCQVLPASGELLSALAMTLQLALQVATDIPPAVYVLALRLLRTVNTTCPLHNLSAPKCAGVRWLRLQLTAA